MAANPIDLKSADAQQIAAIASAAAAILIRVLDTRTKRNVMAEREAAEARGQLMQELRTRIDGLDKEVQALRQEVAEWQERYVTLVSTGRAAAAPVPVDTAARPS